ncbi:MAG: hypothetical protein ACREF4_22730, partial [Gammaproteobacteria bacterium]
MKRIALCLILLASTIAAQTPQHPLDALAFDEFWTVLEVLREAGHLDGETRFSAIDLKEPPKDQV